MCDDVEGGETSGASAYGTFRSLVESADRKFARVRDLPPYVRGPLHAVYYRKVFKAYTRLWRFQQAHRRALVHSGLRRCEIGEIASRIGQLYYGQYQRTSEARFLLESYIFYEAILSRRYFESPSATDADLVLRYKELRFHARFLIVAMLLNRKDVVVNLAERLRALVGVNKSLFRETNFKEWKQVLQEAFRFLKADTSFTNIRPLRYSSLFDAHPSSLPYIARLHKRRVLKLQDALLTSYRRNEIKISELTLDTYRMIQCLEWEPSGSYYQVVTTELSDNGAFSDQSGGASGLIDINLSADMTDPSLPANPRKAVIYHPSVAHLLNVLAAICEELSSDSILLIYISGSGKADQGVPYENDSSKAKPSQDSYNNGGSLQQALAHSRLDSSDNSGNCVYLGSRRSGGPNNLYPEDLIPFTRKPLFIIIDSENSPSFKKIHGSERGEAAALLLSPRRPSLSDVDVSVMGSQFTYFLTAPLLAFIQLAGLKLDIDVDVYSKAESILSSAFAEWEVILCTSENLDQVWAQVLPDPFVRRLILRFIFCRAALVLGTSCRNNEQLPDCLPGLPESVSPDSPSIQSYVMKLAETLEFPSHFDFSDDIKASAHRRLS